MDLDSTLHVLKAWLIAGALLGSVLGLTAVIVVVKDLVTRIRRRRATALATPVLKGVPLPAVDDPRWRIEHGLFERKMNKRMDRMWMGDFKVWSIDGEVLFQGHRVGHWRRYVRAVRARFPDGEQHTLAEAAGRALRAPNGRFPEGDWRS